MTLPGLVRANNLNDVVDRERAWDNLGSSLATGDISISAPSLDLNFAANKSLVDNISGNNLITFSRASTGTFVGSNGLIHTAASGVPRFDHNPATGESLGLLVEEARTNSQTYSQGSSLTAGGTGSGSITYNAGVAPDGTTTATSVKGVYTYSAAWPVTGGNYGGPHIIEFNASTRAITKLSSFGGYNAALHTTFATALGNGWHRIGQGYSTTLQVSVFVKADGANVIKLEAQTNTIRVYVDGTVSTGFLVWGAQLEESGASFPTSYIPTTTATVTRAADVASMTGTNFSSWYSNVQGTMCTTAQVLSATGGTFKIIVEGSDSSPTFKDFSLGIDNSGARANFSARFNSGNYDVVAPNSTITSNVSFKLAASYTASSADLAYDGLLASTKNNLSQRISADRMFIGSRPDGGTLFLNGTIARLAYWPSRLNDKTREYITQPSITAINLYAFNYAINGKDVLALNAVRNASTRNFIFIKGLLSAAQPRLTTAAASTSSALTLATNALPKLSPTSSGNYFFASGITLSGVTTRINGTNALSIATSPFSGSTATAPLLFRELRPQANWRFTEPMTSGTIASPEFAIPFETNDFVLFMKAGPN